jgi:hypothetical protein
MVKKYKELFNNNQTLALKDKDFVGRLKEVKKLYADNEYTPVNETVNFLLEQLP